MTTTPLTPPSHLPSRPPRPWRSGLWASTALLARAGEHPLSVAQLGLRTRHPAAEDALALAATGRRLLASELAAHLAEEEASPGLLVDTGAAAALALLWSADRDELRRPDGARLYDLLLSHDLLPALPVHHQGAAQALYLAGHQERLRRVLPGLDRLPAGVRHDLRVDLAHPALPGGQTEDAWVELLTSRFVTAGLAPVRLAEDGPTEHLFDRLVPAQTLPRSSGPLVTIIVPAYQPDGGLVSSVRSLVDQTYADLEIVVVDDASGPGFDEHFATVAAMDPRVRVLTMAHNGGSYLARRAAIADSTGELVTIQDADDWSHPERIARQVAALAERPDSPASRSLAVRAKDDLTHQWFGYPSVRPNASSLMVRRSVLDRAGTFLPMRKSADSEYAERLEVLCGPIVDVDLPLAITRLRVGSLSRADFSYQWHHPDRVAFRGAYRAWHRTLVGTGQAPTDADMPEIPASFARGLDGVAVLPDELDVVLAADLSRPPVEGGERDAVGQALAGLGQRSVGLWHLEGLGSRSGREMHAGWHDLVLARDDLHLVTRTGATRAGTLVVLDPACLMLAGSQEVGLRPEQVLLALRPDVVEPVAGGVPVDLLGAADAAARWWGSRPGWTCAPGVEADDLIAALPGLALVPGPWDPASAGRLSSPTRRG